MDINEFMNKIDARAKKNDKKVSADEEEILIALSKLDENASRLEMYKTVLKTIYKDGYLEKDEGDIVVFVKDLLKIKLNEHQKVLGELRFI